MAGTGISLRICVEFHDEIEYDTESDERHAGHVVIETVKECKELK
jgi:hypothetical protein